MGMSAYPQYRQYEPEGDGPEVVPTLLRAPIHAEAIQLYQYWLGCQERGGLRVGRNLPSREIARLMSKLSVLEPNADQSDFHFRLVGSGWLRRFGRDIKSEWLSSLYDPSAVDHYRAGLRKVLNTGEPTFTDVRVLKDRLEQHHIEYIELPIASFDGTMPCILIGAFRFE